MKKVVITGATGMIGNALLHECLHNEVEILVVTRPDSRHNHRIPKSDLIRLVYCDLDDFAQLDAGEFGTDWQVFYHLAWTRTDADSRNDVEIQHKNIGYTLNALRLAKKLGCSKFVGAGSQAEYGIIENGIISPETQANPLTAYGIAKYASGKLGEILGRSLMMEFVWVRIFSVYGTYDLPTTMISSTIKKLRAGERPQFTAATHLWDYLHSQDAGHALYLVGDKTTDHGLYCLASGHSRLLKEFILELAEITKKDAELGIGEIPYVSPPVSMQVDISDLSHDVGFLPKISFRQGISMLLDSELV